MHVLGAIVLVLCAQAQDVESDKQAGPEPVIQDEGAAYIEESLRQSIERARELADRPGVEWPGMTEDAAPGLSGETQSRLILERMRTAQRPEARLRALEGWVAASTWDTPEVLIEGLMDPHPRVASYAAEALSTFAAEHGDIAELLHRYYIEQLLSGDARLRTGIQPALPALRPVLEAPMLRTLQSAEEEPPRRAAAAYCLGEMGSIKAADALARGAWSEAPVFAYTCAEALLKLPHPRNADQWLRLLKHPQMPVRKLAVDGLSTFGGPGAGEALVEIALGNAEDEVDLRLMAVQALARWPLYESTPLLIRALEGRPGVRNIAHGLLQQRTGVKLQAVPGEWRRWWQEYGRYGVTGPDVDDTLTVRPKPMFDVEYLNPGGAPAEEVGGLEEAPEQRGEE